MISKREFSNVVNQVNARFEYFTSKIEELEAKVDKLETKPAVKKAPAKATKEAA
jgi:outer membrane murein-binding lipoprotein Lpp